MAEPQTLEEAWRNHGLALTSEELDDTARALALAAFEMGVYTKTACGHTWNDEDAERRRIEELGK